MSEWMIQNIVILRLVLIAIFSYFYAVGGLKNKLWRRLGCPIVLLAGVLTVGLFAGTFNYWNLLCIPILGLALSLGYGADETWLKISKRGYCALAYCVSMLPLAITSGLWLLYLLHTLLVVSVVISLGVWNFARNAREEESIIGLSIITIPMFMV